MSLYNLAHEYLNGEALIRIRIKQLRKLLPNAEGDIREELQARLRSLYEMAADANQIGEYLSQYYANSSNKEERVEVKWPQKR